jgi:hypothetical protein
MTERDILAATKGDEGRARLQWQVTVRFGTTTERIRVIPDAAFAIDRQYVSGKRRFYFFLEVDRGTMPLKRKNLRLSSIHRKVLAYTTTRRNRILAEQFSIPGFQVLFVTRSKERLEGITETCRRATHGWNSSLFLFSTTQDLTNKNPLWYNGNDPLHSSPAQHSNP